MDTSSRGGRRGKAQRTASSSSASSQTIQQASPALSETDNADTQSANGAASSAGRQDMQSSAPVELSHAPQPALTTTPLIILETALFPTGRLTLAVSRPSAIRAMRAAYNAGGRCLVALYPPSSQPDVHEPTEQEIIALLESSENLTGDDPVDTLDTPSGKLADDEQNETQAIRSERPQLAIAQSCAIATLADIKQYEEQGENSLEVIVEGMQRVSLSHWVAETPYLRAAWAEAPDSAPSDQQATLGKALTRHAQALFERLTQLSKKHSAEELALIKGEHVPGRLADRLAARIPLDPRQQLETLTTRDPLARLESVCVALDAEVETLELENKIRQKVRQQVEKNQREYYLKEQLRAIQEELGTDQSSEVRELRERLESKGCPPDVMVKLAKELDRLERMPAHSAELAVLRNYLDWALALPWQERTEDNTDMRHAQGILDDEQYGLEKVKERIIEFLAVRQMRLLRAQRQAAAEAPSSHSDGEDAAGAHANPNVYKGPILCLIGPPGVGKTSLGRSIAHALGRKFFRISLGGVHDEAEIRGHRRTYVGALPGRVIQAMKTVGVRNPVIVLDEIDKLASDYRGDPSSALLEALDPEQNQGFTDHYLEVPYDLSEVFFICTGNNRFQIPRALADRMDIIEIPGYTEEEKMAIGRTFLLPKVIDQCGLAPGQAQVSPAAMRFLVTRYTREAGVRNLERSLDAICRKIALRILQKSQKTAKPDTRVRVTEKVVEDYLGAPRYSLDRTFEPGQVGMAMGLAWTSTGGALLPVEVLTMPGKGALMITGQPGEVMQESARAAFSYIRSRADD
ncbi:MAG TPA: endopeptidase La, partial [Ktedonobacterales bacterium]|nr:endopeptidase La [Ktedonobacterales bacterium]